jgi:hypothetical protein
MINEGKIKTIKPAAQRKYLGKGFKGDLSIASIADCETSHTTNLVALLKGDVPFAFRFRDGKRFSIITQEEIQTAKELRLKGDTIKNIMHELNVDWANQGYRQLIEDLLIDTKPYTPAGRSRYIKGVMSGFLGKVYTIHQYGDSYSTMSSIDAIKEIISKQKGKRGKSIFGHSMSSVIEHTTLSEEEITQFIMDNSADCQTITMKGGKDTSIDIRSVDMKPGVFARKCVELLKAMDNELPFRKYFVDYPPTDPYREAAERAKERYGTRVGKSKSEE